MNAVRSGSKASASSGSVRTNSGTLTERPECFEQRPRSGDALGVDLSGAHRLSRGLLQAGRSRLSGLPGRSTSLSVGQASRSQLGAGAGHAAGAAASERCIGNTSRDGMGHFKFSSVGGEVAGKFGLVNATGETGRIEHDDALSRLQLERQISRSADLLSVSQPGVDERANCHSSRTASPRVSPFPCGGPGLPSPKVACCSPALSTGHSRASSAMAVSGELPVEAALAEEQPVSSSRRPSRASSQLPEAATAKASPVLPGVAQAALKLGGKEGDCAASSSSSSVQPTSLNPRSRMRNRLAADLSVKTHAVDLGMKKSLQMFRLLKDGQSINDFYDFGDEIFSSGCLSKVLTARKKSDNSEVVVKMRPKGRDKVSERGWRQIMSQLGRVNGHSHVLDISEILEDSSTYYIVMPKCDGGELFDLLATAEEIPERECKRIIREILAAVGHLHKNDLIHRDIKPENILFDSDKRRDSASPKTVKLIDFDTVAGWTPQSPKTKTFVGTPGYIAPEVLLGEASPQSDLWSIGVIFYILMTGDSPWSSIASLEDGTVGSPKARKVYDQMKSEVLDWESDPWPAFPLARDLCQQLIAFDTKSRLLSVQEALSHPWLQET